MQRTLGIMVVVLFALLLGALGMRLWDRPTSGPALPDGPAVITQMREVARLETLDATLFKKVTFAPDPVPSGSFWGDVREWAKFTLAPTHGKAIIFADVHMGVNVEQLDLDHLRLTGDRAEIVLPPLTVDVSLRPGDTEVIQSNLDAKETAQLLELAKNAFAQEAAHDPGLQRKAKASAERAIRGLLRSLGYREVVFVPALPQRSNAL